MSARYKKILAENVSKIEKILAEKCQQDNKS